MPAFKDIRGKMFGRLLVIDLKSKATGKGLRTYWMCKCDCGTIKSVASDALISGKTVSCGCYRLEQVKKMGKRKCTQQN